MKHLLLLSFVFSFSAVAQTKTTFDQVAPIFEAKCLSCHGNQNKAGGVDLSGYNELLDYVVPGIAGQSDLWIQIASGSMPMGQKMTAEEKLLIKKWIVDGALPGARK